MPGIFGGINVISVTVHDLAEARQFYRDTLSSASRFKICPKPAGSSAPPAPLRATSRSCRPHQGWTPSTGTTVVLNVQDCHAAVGLLRGRGVTCDDPQVFPGFVTFASFYDPSGNRLQMCSPEPAA